MAVNVLVVDIHAELYRNRLVAEFPDLQFRLFHSAAEVAGNLSDIDVMIMFGIEIRDQMLRDAPRLEMDPVFGDGRRSFSVLPVLAR